MTSPADDRLKRLLAAVEQLLDPSTPRGQAARARWTQATGLSREGVHFALKHSLEQELGAANLAALISSAPACKSAHVVLSSTVFTSAVRALALALAASSSVLVKASSRESSMAQLLAEVDADLFTLVDQLEPSSGDCVWVYGSSETIQAIEGDLPAGVALMGFGHGVGVAVVAQAPEEELALEAKALAQDAALFDQRGCLSPRLVVFSGDPSAGMRFSKLLADALLELASAVPRGRQLATELADLAWYKQTLLCVGEQVLASGAAGSVGWSEDVVLLPPAGRNLHVVMGAEDTPLAIADLVTCVGYSARASAHRAALSYPGARVVPLGMMQCPPLDGPADMRRYLNPRG